MVSYSPKPQVGDTKDKDNKKRKKTMIAITSTDKCFATKSVASCFNTDNVERTHLEPDVVRSAFDFTIGKRPSYDFDGRPIPGHYHLVREDTNDFIPSAGIGKKFEPVQHMEVFDYITNKIMPAVPEMELETVGTLHGGGTGLIMAKIGDEFHINGDNSPNTMRLMFSNPCNGYGSLIIGFTTVRLWCQNQIPVAIRQTKANGFQIRHTKNASLYVGDALEVIHASIEKARDIRRKSEGLAKVRINQEFIRRVMDEIYPIKEDASDAGVTRTENVREEVIKQFEEGATAQTIEGDTAWKLFNAFTYPIYNPVSTKKSVDLAEVAYTGAIGTRAGKVQKIFNTIYNETMRMAA